MSGVRSTASLAALIALPGLASAQGNAALSLSQAVGLAVASHPAIAAARATDDETEARVAEARAAWLPQITAQGTVTRFELPMIVAPLHGFDPSRPPTFDRTLLQGAAQVGYTVFDGGARGARIGAARAEAQGATADLEAALLRVTAETVRAYLAVISVHSRCQAQEQSLAALAAERSRVLRALDAGRAARVDLLRVEAAMAQAEAERVGSAEALDVAELTLARLLAVDPERTRAARLARVRLRDTSITLDRATVLRRAGATSPELARARRRAEAADFARRAARAAWFPRLDLGGGYLGFGGGTVAFTAEWQASARITYPVFQGGARAAAISAATSRAQAVAEQYRTAELELEAALDRALAAAREARARVAALTRAVDHLTEVVRIEQLALDAGAGTQSDFLRADADLRRSRAALIEAQYGEILARVDLGRLTGELSADWLATIVESVP
jgi:outer membrane protein